MFSIYVFIIFLFTREMIQTLEYCKTVKMFRAIFKFLHYFIFWLTF